MRNTPCREAQWGAKKNVKNARSAPNCLGDEIWQFKKFMKHRLSRVGLRETSVVCACVRVRCGGGGMRAGPRRKIALQGYGLGHFQLGIRDANDKFRSRKDGSKKIKRRK